MDSHPHLVLVPQGLCAHQEANVLRVACLGRQGSRLRECEQGRKKNIVLASKVRASREHFPLSPPLPWIQCRKLLRWPPWGRARSDSWGDRFSSFWDSLISKKNWVLWFGKSGFHPLTHNTRCSFHLPCNFLTYHLISLWDYYLQLSYYSTSLLTKS